LSRELKTIHTEKHGGAVRKRSRARHTGRFRGKKLKVVAILASHNRAALTQKLLTSLEYQISDGNFSVDVVAVDDGSKDETSAILKNSPLVRLVHTGDGSLYWAASMAIAEKIALEMLDKDESEESKFILWLNDDVDLMPNALSSAIIHADKHPGSIIVGHTISKMDEKLTYGSFYRSGKHPLSFKLQTSDLSIAKPQTFNGNFVLVPFGAATIIGGINGDFSHGMADIEYGIRATKGEISIVNLPTAVGYCERNEIQFYKKRKDAWASYTGKKGAGNWKSMTLLLKASSSFWFFWALVTYSLWWLRRIIKSDQYKA
jgi:GT2 family glycosyltransferase